MYLPPPYAGVESLSWWAWLIVLYPSVLLANDFRHFLPDKVRRIKLIIDRILQLGGPNLNFECLQPLHYQVGSVDTAPYLRGAGL